MDKMDGFVYLYISHLLILIHPFHSTFHFPTFCFWKGDFHFYKTKNLSTDKKCKCLQQSFHEAFDLLPIVTRI